MGIGINHTPIMDNTVSIIKYTIFFRLVNQKETDKWFQAQGHRVPMRGAKYGFISSITYTYK